MWLNRLLCVKPLWERAVGARKRAGHCPAGKIGCNASFYLFSRGESRQRGLGRASLHSAPPISTWLNRLLCVKPLWERAVGARKRAGHCPAGKIGCNASFYLFSRGESRQRGL